MSDLKDGTYLLSFIRPRLTKEGDERDGKLPTVGAPGARIRLEDRNVAKGQTVRGVLTL